MGFRVVVVAVAGAIAGSRILAETPVVVRFATDVAGDRLGSDGGAGGWRKSAAAAAATRTDVSKVGRAVCFQCQ